MMLVERPDYRIDSRTIKRGSRPSIMIVSFVESSNLCIHAIIFIGSYFGSYRGVVLVLVMTKPRSPKTVCICVSFCVFGIGDFAGSSVRKIYIFHLVAKSPLLVCLLQRLLLLSSFQQNWFYLFRTSFAKDVAFPVCEKEFLNFPIWS